MIQQSTLPSIRLKEKYESTYSQNKGKKRGRCFSKGFLLIRLLLKGGLWSRIKERGDLFRKFYGS